MKLSKDPEYLAWKLANAKPHGNSRLLTYRGETKSIKQWSALLGLSEQTIRLRLYRLWTVEQTLETPTKANQYS